MVTVDPARDTPVLADYVQSFVPDAHAIATDDQAALQSVAAPFGVSYEVRRAPTARSRSPTPATCSPSTTPASWWRRRGRSADDRPTTSPPTCASCSPPTTGERRPPVAGGPPSRSSVAAVRRSLVAPAGVALADAGRADRLRVGGRVDHAGDRQRSRSRSSAATRSSSSPWSPAPRSWSRATSRSRTCTSAPTASSRRTSGPRRPTSTPAASGGGDVPAGADPTAAADWKHVGYGRHVRLARPPGPLDGPEPAADGRARRRDPDVDAGDDGGRRRRSR